jgi:hypothetical protein
MNPIVRPATLLLCAATVALAVPLAGLVHGRVSPLPDDLIVVQIPVAAAPPSREPSYRPTPLDRYVNGARIVRVDPARRDIVVLTPEFVGACDPDVSFDGQTIVFAGKRNPEDSWQIWKMNTDGSGKVQLTQGSEYSVGPVFAGARFYLDDPEPTPQIVFARSTGASGSFALFGTDVDGKALHRLTFNPVSDFAPAVLPTGRIVFTSWQRYGDSDAPNGRLALLAVNIDGTDLMPFHGNHEPPRFKDMATVARVGDRVYFVESDRWPWLGGGDLAYVSWRRPLTSYRSLNAAADDGGVFHSPAPLPDGGLLASYRASADSVFAIYRLDPETGRRVGTVFEQAGWHAIDAQALAERAPVPGRSNWLKPGATTGVFYCLNSYRTSLGEGPNPVVAPPGTIKHVRVIEAQQRRILGIAPVEPDGSFHIRVPAETPITFQLLDADYLALRTQRTWTWVMGNENRGCVGCHEDRELAPPNRMVTALIKPPVDLALPVARRRTVDFRHQIAPIVVAQCATAGCHTTGGAAPLLGEPTATMSEATLRAAYASLLEQPAGRHEARYVVPGEARASPLIRLLLGRDPDGHSAVGTPHDGLGRREKLLFIEWVDLGAAWDARLGDTGGTP